MWLEMENGFYRLDYDQLYLETLQKHDWHQTWEVKSEEAMTEEGKQDNSLQPSRMSEKEFYDGDTVKLENSNNSGRRNRGSLCFTKFVEYRH